MWVFDAIPDVMRYEKAPFKDIATVRSAQRLGDIALSMRQTDEFRSVEIAMTALMQALKMETVKRLYGRIVIDSLTALKYFGMKGFDDIVGAQVFLRFLSDLKITAIVTMEEGPSERAPPELLIARGEFHLYSWEADGLTMRAIGVEKFRGSPHDRYLHPYRITSHGVEIDPTVSIARGTSHLLATPPEVEAMVRKPSETELQLEAEWAMLTLLDDVSELAELGIDAEPVRHLLQKAHANLSEMKLEDSFKILLEARQMVNHLILTHQVSEEFKEKGGRLPALKRTMEAEPTPVAPNLSGAPRADIRTLLPLLSRMVAMLGTKQGKSVSENLPPKLLERVAKTMLVGGGPPRPPVPAATPSVPGSPTSTSTPSLPTAKPPVAPSLAPPKPAHSPAGVSPPPSRPGGLTPPPRVPLGTPPPTRPPSRPPGVVPVGTPARPPGSPPPSRPPSVTPPGLRPPQGRPPGYPPRPSAPGVVPGITRPPSPSVPSSSPPKPTPVRNGPPPTSPPPPSMTSSPATPVLARRSLGAIVHLLGRFPALRRRTLPRNGRRLDRRGFGGADRRSVCLVAFDLGRLFLRGRRGISRGSVRGGLRFLERGLGIRVPRGILRLLLPRTGGPRLGRAGRGLAVSGTFRCALRRDLCARDRWEGGGRPGENRRVCRHSRDQRPRGRGGLGRLPGPGFPGLEGSRFSGRLLRCPANSGFGDRRGLPRGLFLHGPRSRKARSSGRGLGGRCDLGGDRGGFRERGGGKRGRRSLLRLDGSGFWDRLRFRSHGLRRCCCGGGLRRSDLGQLLRRGDHLRLGSRRSLDQRSRGSDLGQLLRRGSHLRLGSRRSLDQRSRGSDLGQLLRRGGHLRLGGRRNRDRRWRGSDLGNLGLGYREGGRLGLDGFSFGEGE